MIEVTGMQARNAYEKIRASIAFPNEALSPEVTQFSQFQAETIGKMAKVLGILSSTAPECPKPVVTQKMIRLAMSDDPRKWKRAWRLYFDQNGKLAPHSFFHLTISNYRTAIARLRMQQFQKSVYAAWIKEAVASGQVELPSTEAQERK